MQARILKFGAAVLAIGMLGLPVQAQTDAAPADEIDSQALGDGIYLLTGPGGNIGMSTGDDGVFVIDDKFDRFAEQIIDEIESLTDAPLRFVVNTHYHGDHTGANAAMKSVGAMIVAHENVRSRMGQSFRNELWDRMTEATDESLWPTITFSENMTFHFNGQPVQVIHVPNAHTDGDSIIYFESANVLHMGDNFFNGLFPYVDIDGGGSLQGMIDAQAAGLALADDETQIIPGHGPMSSREDLMMTRDMLIDIQQRVEEEMASGLSLDEILEKDLLSDLSDYESFIDRVSMVKIAYRSLNLPETD